MSQRSNRVANWLRERGVARGDRVILMLGNQVELWETILAAMKLGAVIIPATPLLGPADLRDRLDRGNAAHVVVGSASTAKFADVPGDYTRIAVGDPVDGWLRYADAYGAGAQFTPGRPHQGRRSAAALLHLRHHGAPEARRAHPRLVPGRAICPRCTGSACDPATSTSTSPRPGWAKHAWSNVFAPWNAGACVFIYNYTRFDAAALLAQMDRCGVTSFCAPPTVWRMLVQADLSRLRTPPPTVVGAGEPLNPEVIEQVQRAWGVTIRDGFGQTETTVQVANTPGQTVKPGSMGRAMPGYTVALIDPATGKPADEGEICLDLASARSA